MPGLHRDQSEGQGIPRDHKARRTNNNEGGVKKRPGLLCKRISLATEFRTCLGFMLSTDLFSIIFYSGLMFDGVCAIKAFCYEFFY